MSSGYTVQSNGGKDLDDIFDAYQSGTKPAATGYKVGSQDLKDRYNPISEGEAATATHMSVQGVGDLNTIFAAAGTSTQALVIPFGSYSATSDGSHDAGASFGLVLSSDGTWSIAMQALRGSTSGTPVSGTWHRHPGVGAGNDYEVRFTAYISLSTTGTAPAGSYTATTGWLSLSSDQGVAANTGHISSGGSPTAGASRVNGYWTVDIRRSEGGPVRTSTCLIGLDAIST